MKRKTVFKNEENKPINRDEVLKATALLYFKDALLTEKYEDCAELIRIAKGFGAERGDIKDVIAECNRGLEAVRTNGANLDVGGRLRFC